MAPPAWLSFYTRRAENVGLRTRSLARCNGRKREAREYPKVTSQSAGNTSTCVFSVSSGFIM